jgi:NTP pyrophosphatase (non-canonical NTP hydrolase)
MDTDKEASAYWPDIVYSGSISINTDELAGQLEKLASWVNTTGREKGFWDEDVDTSDGIKFCKMHGEISESVEAIRRGNPASKKIPQYSQLEEELADVVILVFDYGRQHGLDIGAAIISKALYNMDRPRLNGDGKQF